MIDNGILTSNVVAKNEASVSTNSFPETSIGKNILDVNFKCYCNIYPTFIFIRSLFSFLLSYKINTHYIHTVYVQLFVSCLVSWKSRIASRSDTAFASSSDTAFPTDET